MPAPMDRARAGFERVARAHCAQAAAPPRMSRSHPGLSLSGVIPCLHTPRPCATCSSSCTRCSSVVDELKALPRHAEIDADTINAVLEEGGKFASEVLAPLNAIGDAEGCTLDKATHEVTTPKGFKEAYAQYVEGGWPALQLRSGVRRPGPAAHRRTSASSRC